MDFLPPIYPHYAGIFIKSMDLSETIDLDTFFMPFKKELWMMLLAITIIITLNKLILLKFYECQYIVQNIFESFWTSIKAFFGGKPDSSLIDTKQSYKMVIFISLLCGLFVWQSYRAHLTAELAVYMKAYPFKNLNSISKTNWRYLSFITFFKTHFEL